MRKCFLCYGENADGALVCRWCNQELPPLQEVAPARPVASAVPTASSRVLPRVPTTSVPSLAEVQQPGTNAARVTDGPAAALSAAVNEIDRLSGFWNWNSMAEVD